MGGLNAVVAITEFGLIVMVSIGIAKIMIGAAVELLVSRKVSD